MSKTSILLIISLFCNIQWAVAKDAYWEIEPSYDNQIFPSFAWATAHLSNELGGNEIGNFYGDGNAQIMVLFDELKKGTHVKIVSSCPQIMEESTLEFEMGATQQNFFAGLPLAYDYDKLLQWKQPKPVNFKVSVYLNDKLQGTKQKNIIVKSIYDCLFLAVNKWSVVSDLNHNYTAYVNENHPIITDTIIPEIMSQGLIDAVLGYQATDNEVLRQVYAIWHYFNKAKFSYSALNNYYKSGMTLPITRAQYVRTFSDIYRTRSANCVDGTILFASILMKMGISPYLVMTPNHCYLGFKGGGSEPSMYFLETTLLGKDLSIADEETQEYVKNAEITDSDLNYRLSFDTEKTYNNFVWALLSAKSTFINDQDKYKKENEGYTEVVSADSLSTVLTNLNYQMISVIKYRELGLMSLNL